MNDPDYARRMAIAQKRRQAGVVRAPRVEATQEPEITLDALAALQRLAAAYPVNEGPKPAVRPLAMPPSGKDNPAVISAARRRGNMRLLMRKRRAEGIA